MGVIAGITLSSLDSATWLNILLDVSIKGTIVLAGAGVATAALKRASAPTRHLVWFLALASLILLPILSAGLPAWRVPILPSSFSRVATARVATSDPVASEPTPAVRVKSGSAESIKPVPSSEHTPASSLSGAFPLPETWDWSALALMGWALGAVLVLVYFVVGAVTVWIIAWKAQPVGKDSPWGSLVEGVMRQFGHTKRHILLESERVSMPMMWGLLRPVVLLPTGGKAWPEERRQIVLLHELAHLKRRDCLAQTLVQLACVFYWFNPLVWFAARRLRVERERACDDQVLNSGLKASDYAGHLLEIAREVRRPHCPAMAAVAMACRSNLEGRLLAILDANRPRRALARLTIAIALFAVASIIFPLGIMWPVVKGAELPKEAKDSTGSSRRTVQALGEDSSRIGLRREGEEAGVLFRQYREFTRQQEGPRHISRPLYEEVVSIIEREYIRSIEIDRSKAPDVNAVLRQLDGDSAFLEPGKLEGFEARLKEKIGGPSWARTRDLSLIRTAL